MKDTTRNVLTVAGGFLLLLGFGITNTLTLRGYEEKIQGLQTDLGQTKADLAATQEDLATKNMVLKAMVDDLLVADSDDIRDVFGGTVYVPWVQTKTFTKGKVEISNPPTITVHPNSDDGLIIWLSIKDGELHSETRLFRTSSTN